MLTVPQIQECFDRIISMANAYGTDNHPVGILTAQHRDQWTSDRNSLVLSSPINEASLERIQSALFLVCLDDDAPVTRNQVARSLIHSDGCNRFWDKSFQAVFFKNGKAGYVGEHSMMDGLTTTRFVNETLAKLFADNEAEANPVIPGWSSVDISPCDFVLGASSKRAISRTRSWFDALMATKELKVLMFHGYGKQQIKKFRMSPDAFAQMAMQLAHHKTFGKRWCNVRVDPNTDVLARKN